IRNDVPEMVGRTINRTVLLLSAGVVSRTLCETDQAENHCEFFCAMASSAGRHTKIDIASIVMDKVRVRIVRPCAKLSVLKSCDCRKAGEVWHTLPGLSNPSVPLIYPRCRAKGLPVCHGR